MNDYRQSEVTKQILDTQLSIIILYTKELFERVQAWHGDPGYIGGHGHYRVPDT